MTKKFISLLLTVLILVAFVFGSAWSRNKYDAQPSKMVDPYTGKIMDYNIKGIKVKPTAWGDDDLVAIQAAQREAAANEPSPRVSLGRAAASPTAVASPGLDVYDTYMDDQYRAPGKRLIDFRGKYPAIHFAYSRSQSKPDDSRSGYTVYDPVKGTWPQGFNLGCVIQQSGETGQHATMDVKPNGKVVLAVADNAGSSSVENHMYWQPGNAAGTFSCTWGAGSSIDQTQYNQYFVTKDVTNTLTEPQIEVQEWAGDTITHVLGKEAKLTDYKGVMQNSATFGTYTLNYFRKVGSAVPGSWTGPICIDTVNNISNGNGTHNGCITASRVSPKVAVAYVHWLKNTPLKPNADTKRYDNDIWYRVSDSVGLVWGPKINLTNYSRTLASYTSFLSVNALYDHQGYLHIIWDAGATVANVYSNSDYFWGDFSTNIFHWSNRTNQIAKAHNAQWGIDVNTQTCGFGSPGTGYVGFYTMSECENRLYIVFSQYLNFFGDDVTPTTPKNLDDCANAKVQTEKTYRANGELYMVVSKDLDGILWDAARNITKTYTPGCDSAGYGGVCMNDTRSSLSRYGMDVTSYDTNGTPVTLIWPGTDKVDLTPSPGSYSGNQYIMMFYTEDHFPAPSYRDRTTTATYGPATLNPLRFVRLACAAPVNAPKILTDTTVIGYPAFTHHGTPKVVTVTVTNEGNATLHVSSIVGVKQTQQAKDWLGLSVSSMDVTAGIPNTATFDITLNKGGVINTPGTVVNLSGLVYLKSDAKFPRDSIEIAIDRFLVADTITQVVWDTVGTNCLRLIVSNNGIMGKNGNGRAGTVNMDYVGLGLDCDTISSLVPIYLYDGGPYINREVTAGAVYTWSSALFTNGFAADEAFKPIAASGAGPITNAAYDGYFTGTFVNRDSTIGLRRTYYAPTSVSADSCHFIIVKTQVFPFKGTAVSNVTIGEQIDWDIPADSGAANSAGILLKKGTVYNRGFDTMLACPTPGGTTRDSSRYGAAVLLGMYNKAEIGANVCANDRKQVGVFAARQDTLTVNYDTLPGNLEGKYYWNRCTNTETGVSTLQAWEGTGARDLRNIYTWKKGYNFTIATDTVTVFTAMATVKQGTKADIDTALYFAMEWYKNHLRPGCPGIGFGTCCAANSSDGRTGNVDADPGLGVDISDLSALIDYLYISFTVPSCLLSANIDGDPADGVDISDLSALIDYLYISFTPPALCH